MIETRAIDLTPQGLERSSQMLRESMPGGGHFTANILDWQYNANPIGKALGLEAWDGDQLLSHCVVQPLIARLHGREVRGVMSMNAATHPSAEGKGLYFGLARELYGEATAAGFDFGVAVTNDRSTPGFVKHCNFEVIRPLEARIGFGRISMARAEIETDFEKLWNPETIAWRLSPPHVCYRHEQVGQAMRVFAPTGRFGIEAVIGHVPPATVPMNRPTRRRTAQPLQLWVGLDERIDWKASFYRDIPMRFRPSPLNLIFSDLTKKGVGVDPQRARWSGLDFDDF
jgi:hypothetical protein